MQRKLLTHRTPPLPHRPAHPPLKGLKGIKGLLFTAVPLLLLSGAALGGDGISVNITNDGTEDILVTVYDNAIGRHVVVLAHARINGFTSVPVSMSPDASGQANLSWTAVSTDSSDRKCGHADNVQLGDSSTVAVHADSRCGSSST